MQMKKKIGLMEVKQALKDERFRNSLPPEMKPDLDKFLKDQGCACNVPIYKKVIRDHSDKLKEYYPGKEVMNEKEEAAALSQNKFSVINCHKDDLEKNLHNLPTGRKQIAVARFEDQVTVVVNELDLAF